MGDDCLRLFEASAERRAHATATAAAACCPSAVVIDRPVHGGSGAVRNPDGWLALARRAIEMVAATMSAQEEQQQQQGAEDGSGGPAALAPPPSLTVRAMVLEPPSQVAASTMARLYGRLMEEQEEREDEEEEQPPTPTSVRVAAVLPRPSASLALLSRGRTTGLVVDVGDGGAWAAPVVDGAPLPLGARRSPAGGALAAEWALEAVLRPAARRQRRRAAEEEGEEEEELEQRRQHSPPLPSCAWWAAEAALEEQEEDDEERRGTSSGGGGSWRIAAGQDEAAAAAALQQPGSAADAAALSFLRRRVSAGAMSAARTAVAAHRAGTLERLAVLERGRTLALRLAARGERAAVSAAAAGGGGGLKDGKAPIGGGGAAGGEAGDVATAAAAVLVPPLLLPSLAGADGPGVAAAAALAVREGAAVDLRRALLSCVLVTGGAGSAMAAQLAPAVRQELARHWPALQVRVLGPPGASEAGVGGGKEAPAPAPHAAFIGAASLAESMLERSAPCCEAEGWLLPSKRGG